MFSVIDVETTGLSPKYNDRIIEVGIVKIDEEGVISGGFETLINPDREPGPVHIHGISNSMVSRAPRFSEIAPDIIDFISGTYVTAHNSGFDFSFLNSEFAMAGLDFRLSGLCTLKIAREILPQLPSRSLEYLSRHFKITNKLAHSAYSDALAAAELLIIFLREYNYEIKYNREVLTENCIADFPGFCLSGKKLKRSDLTYSYKEG